MPNPPTQPERIEAASSIVRIVDGEFLRLRHVHDQWLADVLLNALPEDITDDEADDRATEAIGAFDDLFQQYRALRLKELAAERTGHAT